MEVRVGQTPPQRRPLRHSVKGCVWQFFGYLGADWPTCMLCSFIAAALFFTVFVAPILAELVTEWSAAKPFLHDVELLNHSDKRYRKFQEPGKHIEERDKRERSSTALWDECVGSYKRFRELVNGGDRDWVGADALQAKCARLANDVDRNEDPDCRARWMHELLASDVVGVGRVTGFGTGNLGSMQLFLKDGSSAMFKPCAGPGEWPENEVIASHIDAALGFHRVAPVVTRKIEAADVRAVLERDANWLQRKLDLRLAVLDHIEAYCSPDGMLQGSMIGWWTNLEPTVTFAKKMKRLTAAADLEQLHTTADEHALAEVVQNHFFFYLVGTLRVPGYNEYQASYGADTYLLAVDLDRSTFQQARTPAEVGLSACGVCKVWESTWKSLQAANDDNALVTAVRYSLQFDPGRIALWPSEETVLQARVGHLVACVLDCIAKYGWDGVVVPDPS